MGAGQTDDEGIASIELPDRAERPLGELVSLIYGIAITPERIHELVSFWAEQIERANTTADASGASLPRSVLPHLDQAEGLLKSALRGHRGVTDSVNTWVQQKQHAAFAVTRGGQIVAANAAASAAFGVHEGSSIRELAVAGAEDPAALIASLGTVPKIMSLRGRSADEVYAAVLKHPIVEGGDCVGVTADYLEWSTTLSGLLQASYRLTAAEIEVLQLLMRGRSANDVAIWTGRSVPTVRTHIHALIGKTGARNQMELLRLCLGLMSLAADAPTPSRAPATVRNGSGWRRETQFERVRLPDGRDRA